MADTERTKSAILTLFADNTAGNISAQDLRDFVVSCFPGWASMYISTPAATSISGAGTDTKVAGTMASVSLRNFTMPADNRLLYTGSPDCHVHAVVSFSSTLASGTNKTLEYVAYHYDDSAASGAVVEHSRMSALHGNTDEQTGAIHFDLTMSTNDYLEFWVANATDTTNVTMTKMYMFVMGMLT